MLTELQKVAFRLHSRIFSVLYPIPFLWEKDFSRITVSDSAGAWIPWILALLSISVFGIASLLAPVYASFRPTCKLDGVQSTILSYIGISIMILTVITIVTLKCLSAIISVINEGLELSYNLAKEYPVKRPFSVISSSWREPLRDHLTDRYGLILVAGVLYGSFVPLVATFAALYTNYDVTYVVLEETLTHPMYRELNEILFAFVVRTSFVFFISLEGVRSVSFFGCCAVCGIDNGSKIIEILMKRVSDFQQFLHIYTRLRLFCGKIQEWLNVVIYLGLGLLFWTTVGCCWCCVKCYGKVLWPVYYASTSSAIGLVMGHVILLPPSVKAAEMCIQVVELHYKRAKLKYAMLKTFRTKIRSKQGVACAPIKFKYGIFWVIGKRFVREYFCILLLRTFDAILIIDY